MKITRSKFKSGGESVRPPFDEWNLKDDLMKMDGADENFLSLFEWHYTEKRILDGKTATKIVHNCQYSTPPLIWRIERKGHSRCEEVFPQVTTFFFPTTFKELSYFWRAIESFIEWWSDQRN